MKRVKIFIADDKHADALEKALQLEKKIWVVGKARLVSEVLPRLKQSLADVVILDLQWGGSPDAGWKLISEIRSWDPYIRIIIHTAYSDIANSRPLPSNTDVVFKSVPLNELTDIIVDTCNQETSSNLNSKINLLRWIFSVFLVIAALSALLIFTLGLQNTITSLSLALCVVLGLTAIALLLYSSKQTNENSLDILKFVFGILRGIR